MNYNFHEPGTSCYSDSHMSNINFSKQNPFSEETEGVSRDKYVLEYFLIQSENISFPTLTSDNLSLTDGNMTCT